MQNETVVALPQQANSWPASLDLDAELNDVIEDATSTKDLLKQMAKKCLMALIISNRKLWSSNTSCLLRLTRRGC